MRLPLLITCAVALLLLVAVGCEREITGNAQSAAATASSACFDCHSDQDLSLVQARIQYENSIHFEGENVERNHLNAPYYRSCEPCHTSEGFLASLAGESTDGSHFTAIHCFTCHQPHSSTEGLQVRVTSAVSLQDGSTFDRGSANLCAECHQSRRDVTTTVVDLVELDIRFGPHHSNQADMLIGENAYEYENYDYDKSAHSLAPQGCVHCHMSQSVFETVGGHAFNMRDDDKGHENITGCNDDNYSCHGGTVDDLDHQAEADFDWDGTTEGIQAEVHGLLDSLQVLLTDAGLIGEDSDGEIHPIDGRVVQTADSVGALYNWLFVEEDRSMGVHNTDYAVGLLQSAINFLVHGDPNGAGGKAARETPLLSVH